MFGPPTHVFFNQTHTAASNRFSVLVVSIIMFGDFEAKHPVDDSLECPKVVTLHNIII